MTAIADLDAEAHRGAAQTQVGYAMSDASSQSADWLWFALALMVLGFSLLLAASTARPWVPYDPKARRLPEALVLIGLVLFGGGLLLFLTLLP